MGRNLEGKPWVPARYGMLGEFTRDLLCRRRPLCRLITSWWFDMSILGLDMVFVSHANPEDNDFSRWLSLQLGKLGYPVWCDLTRLLGGEDFWSDIEVAIRDGTAKFLFVLSRNSNQKVGPLQELSVALGAARVRDLKDFVIPLRIDDIPFQDINIQVNRLNVVDFSGSWAAGLNQLVAKLELDGVAKDPRFTPSSVAAWWVGGDGPGHAVLPEPEEYLSNWFRIEWLPDSLYVHSLPPFVTFDALKVLPFPFRKVGSLVICFARAEDVDLYLGGGVRVLETWEVDTLKFRDGLESDVRVSAEDCHRVLIHLLSRGWQQFVRSVGMWERRVGYSLDFYVPLGLLQGDRVAVPSTAGGSAWRSLVGYRSVGNRGGGERAKRYWHFAVSGRVAFEPFPMFQLIPRILFSMDGKHLLDDTARVHRYRRSQARDWWNSEWRDRTLGLMWWLSGKGSDIVVPLGPGCSARVNSEPVSFFSPVSYKDP